MFKFLRKPYRFVNSRAENLVPGDVFVYNHLLYEVLEMKDFGPDDVYVLIVPKANGVPLRGPKLAAIPRKKLFRALRYKTQS